MFTALINFLTSDTSGTPGGIELALFVIGTIIIVFGAYYLTKFVSSRAMRMGQGRTIRIRERVMFSRDKMICIVEIYGKIYIVAFTNNAVTLLDSADAKAYHSDEEFRQTGGFSDIFRYIKSNRTGKTYNDAAERAEEKIRDTDDGHEKD